MLKRLFITLILLCFTVPCFAGTITIGKKKGGGACTDHVVTLSSSSNVQTIGDGTNGNIVGTQITPGNDGTIKSIGIGTYSDGTAGVWTLVWKKNATNGNDLSSGAIDTLTSDSISTSAWVDFDVTDTAITTSDTFTVGLRTDSSGYGHLKVAYAVDGSAAEVAWENWGGASWTLDNNEIATRDWNIRYTICY
jgi:hypothetical protein